MLQSADVVLAYLASMTEGQFYGDEEKQDAVMRRMMIVGEAANRVSEETRLSWPNIKWPKVRGMRNRLIPEYDDINLAIVWQTAQTILLELITKLKDAIPFD
ncbi:MAG: HepT-like ribonuclease domain-containing protein [Cyanobacteria bacterium J06621_3]